jgi:transposase
MIMVAVNEEGIPLNVVVDSASVYEGHLAEETVNNIGIKNHDSCRKQPILKKPKRVIADKGYDDDGLRKRFAEREIDFIVPYRDNRVNRPYEDGRKLRRYRRRYKVERTNAWLKNVRRITVRWDRNLSAFKGFVHIACICITLMMF